MQTECRRGIGKIMPLMQCLTNNNATPREGTLSRVWTALPQYIPCVHKRVNVSRIDILLVNANSRRLQGVFMLFGTYYKSNK